MSARWFQQTVQQNDPIDPSAEIKALFGRKEATPCRVPTRIWKLHCEKKTPWREISEVYEVVSKYFVTLHVQRV